MTTWKKVALWFVGSIIVIVGGFAVLIDHFFEGMCETTIIEEVVSPSGKLKAVVFQIDCGATTDFNSHISIVPADIDASQKNNLPHSFFVADGNHGNAPAGKGGGPEVRIFWKTDDHLDVQYHSNARLFRSETKSKGIIISYTTFR